MKKILLGIAALAAASAFAKEPWRDPTVSSINRLPARAIVVPCESEKTAVAVATGEKPRTASKWISCLNGTWDFKWKHNIEVADWEKEVQIAVPGCWQLQGDFDPALYTNVTYPIAGYNVGDPMLEPPPHYTSYKMRNPVGLYSRTFTLPKGWKGRRTVIHFGGVSSAMYLFLNGKEIGYSEDSRLPAEFDLTDALVAGENKLEVMVLKHCDGSYLEDQDYWRLSGIFRDVWLVSERKDAPKDLVVETTLSDDYATGKVVIRDENGKSLLEKTYANPKLWNCGEPNLYCETVEVKSPGWFGSSDWYAVEFGFCKVEIKDAVVLVNGKRILIYGTNRHEMEPSTGYTVTLEGMKRDIEIMKDLGINAVRTSHYPTDPIWYDLCDRAGIYVCCEANVEAHGVKNFYGANGEYLPKNPLYHNAIVERQVNMVKTFRNHPSIIFWSLGNESGDGPAMAAGYKAIKAIDATRPVQYEGAQDSDHSDVKCPMYHRPWVCENYVMDKPKKPFILCEYTHAMGNSNGDLDAYWSLAKKYPSFQGGFIWDFVDQALWLTDARGTWLSYGGDRGDRPNDDNFCCNGIVAADRTYHPGAYEVRHFYKDLPANPVPEFKPAAAPKSVGTASVSATFKPSYWRAPTDNDRGWGMGHHCRAWKDATVKGLMPAGATGSVTETPCPDGKRLVELKLDVADGPDGKALPAIPRVGYTFTIPKDYVNVTWKGLGPHENYCDRKASASFGTWTAKVGVSTGLRGADGKIGYVENGLNPDNYSEPGEQGHRTGCWSVEFSNAAGKKITVTAVDRPFEFNAWPYTQDQLERAKHQFDLKAVDAITVCIDAAMMGVGGDDSWGAKPHDAHMLGKGEYRLQTVVEGL